MKLSFEVYQDQMVVKFEKLAVPYQLINTYFKFLESFGPLFTKMVERHSVIERSEDNTELGRSSEKALVHTANRASNPTLCIREYFGDLRVKRFALTGLNFTKLRQCHCVHFLQLLIHFRFLNGTFGTIGEHQRVTITFCT